MTKQQSMILLNKVIKNLDTYKIKNYNVNKYVKSQIALLNIVLDGLIKEGK